METQFQYCRLLQWKYLNAMLDDTYSKQQTFLVNVFYSLQSQAKLQQDDTELLRYACSIQRQLERTLESFTQQVQSLTSVKPPPAPLISTSQKTSRKSEMLLDDDPISPNVLTSLTGSVATLSTSLSTIRHALSEALEMIPCKDVVYRESQVLNALSRLNETLGSLVFNSSLAARKSTHESASQAGELEEDIATHISKAAQSLSLFRQTLKDESSVIQEIEGSIHIVNQSAIEALSCAVNVVDDKQLQVEG
ncbi:hypothetical protein BLNAU_5759 [Blattamonas nauphoetae]|uniref:Uncharacterized protein n=1 Tax=Blattamonas nauphoetae TaxID=2049346 RepID=A0ABQ9Y618_9EUKA|nr:hypothetical protein BLNAU_5759 [Blattamonas nauphoetae]